METIAGEMKVTYITRWKYEVVRMRPNFQAPEVTIHEILRLIGPQFPQGPIWVGIDDAGHHTFADSETALLANPDGWHESWHTIIKAYFMSWEAPI